jgi:hypothetical protein
VIYLGKIVTPRGCIKVSYIQMVLGIAPRATRRIVIFNEKNQYSGDYYFTMTYDIPDKIESKYLVFINDKNCDCTPGLVTRVSFRKGIPRQSFLKCKGALGNIYSFPGKNEEQKIL